MMIRGISFKVKQREKGKVLSEIFQSINVKKYNWYNILDQNEVWKNFEEGESFREEYYSGDDFEALINSEHYIIFLKLQAYFKIMKWRNLLTYKEFTEDDCQLIILVSDGEHVEIYAKEISLLKHIYSSAEKNGYWAIEYITDESDRRAGFDIL